MRKIAIILSILLVFGIGFYFGYDSKNSIIKNDMEPKIGNDANQDKKKLNEQEQNDLQNLDGNKKEENKSQDKVSQDTNQSIDLKKSEIIIESNGNSYSNGVEYNQNSDNNQSQNQENKGQDGLDENHEHQNEMPLVPIE